MSFKTIWKFLFERELTHHTGVWVRRYQCKCGNLEEWAHMTRVCQECGYTDSFEEVSGRYEWDRKGSKILNQVFILHPAMREKK
jgi:hypothetical protein